MCRNLILERRHRDNAVSSLPFSSAPCSHTTNEKTFLHLSAGAKLRVPANCIFCALRSNRVVSMTIFRLRRPRGSTAKLSILERISASGGTKEPEGVLHSEDAGRLDAAQKINLVKLDPPIVYCPDAAGDNFRSGDRDVPLVNCNRI